MKYIGLYENPDDIATKKRVDAAIAAIPSAGAMPEIWMFKMEDGSTVIKQVYVDAQSSSEREMMSYAEL